ncbi:MAG: TIGR04282 family arsenosugar biosynthesis glycosyltransferase [candidate division KSB1 bacterium]|nr:TIGR04282 family arsenosugar biosynthesis glycosyltransferase [candidate division KSB1 bacterium]MDQ7064115.1 TIGR04282 family arsenosugar biosynthesis glycosyltransferase [candidate division KSB1 bacterium]
MIDQLVIFAKYPQPGTVKTRLAARIGDEAAADLYGRFIEWILTTMCHSRVAERVVVAVSPQHVVHRFASRYPGADAYEPQAESSDLGERMLAVFEQARRQGVRKTVIIGTDSPTLPPDYVRQAFAILDSHDVVLGPAEDGGYYLIGAKEAHADLFRGIPWSTAQVLQKTLAALQRLQLRHALLPEFFDVDEIDDLHRLREQAPELVAEMEMLIRTEPKP